MLLDRLDAPTHAGSAGGLMTSGTVTSQKGRVLVVDDDPASRYLLRELLEIRGYAVAEARDGQSALEVATSDQPDVILLDVRMPGVGGFQACQRLKADERTAPIPILMVTAL